MTQFGRVPVALVDELVQRQRAGTLSGVSASTCITVYLVLEGVWADRAGRCWPSTSTISDRCGLTERQTRRALTALRDAGALVWQPGERQGRARGSNRYRLTAATPFARPGDDPGRAAMNRTPKSASPPSEPDMGVRITGREPDVHVRPEPDVHVRVMRTPMSEEPTHGTPPSLNPTALRSEDDDMHDPLPLDLAPLDQPKPAKRHSWSDRADGIVRSYRDWYRTERGHPCPQSHTVLAKIVDRFGEVDEGRLKRALAAVPTVSIRAVELELNRSRPRAAAAAQAPADALAAFREREAARAMGGAS